MSSFKKFSICCIGALIIASVLFLACGITEVEDPLDASNYKITKTARLTNQNGVGRRTFYTNETIFANLSNLIVLEQTYIEIVRLSDDATTKQTVVITDRDGDITNLPVWYNVGMDSAGNPVNEAGDYLVHVLQPEKHEPRTIVSIPFSVAHGEPPDPQVYATDASGASMSYTALVGDAVYAKGSGFTPGSTVRLTVIHNQEIYADGEALTDVSGGAEEVTVNADGTLPNTMIIASAAAGQYDIVADTQPFGVYSAGDAVSSVFLTGLLVQEASSTDDIIVDIASDMNGVYRAEFDSLEAIFAKVDPPRRPMSMTTGAYFTNPYVQIYVMPHRENWEKDDNLITIRTIGTMQMASHVQANPKSGALQFVRVRGECKPKYMNPLKLWPGTYDMIVDVNRNGLYDPGTDILDGGSQIGFTIPGTPPPIRLIATTDDDFVGRAMGETKIQVMFIRPDNSGIPNVEVNFSVVVGPGIVTPTENVTDENGYTFTVFTDGEYGVMSRVRIEAYINGQLFWQVVSLDHIIPHTHTQGEVIHNQGVGL